MKKVMSLILAVLFAASAIACSGDTDTTSETTAQAQNGDDPAAETTAETEPPIVSGVPDDLNLNGESVSLWYTTVASSVAETFVDFDPEQTGDILDDATYALNVAVEEKLNVKLDFFNSEVPTSSAQARDMPRTMHTTTEIKKKPKASRKSIRPPRTGCAQI